MEMTGNIPENKEKTTENQPKKKYKCKYCGAEFDELWQLGRHIQSEHKDKIKKKPKKLPEEKPEEKHKEESLFEKPKSPDQILNEVLEEHQVNPRFIEYAVSRAKRLGGLHPMELQKMLTDLKSGIETKAEAQYIVDDYYFALQKEQEKANKLGYRISYPLSFRRGEEQSPFYGMGMGGYQSPYQTGYQTPRTGYTTPQTGYSPYQQPYYQPQLSIDQIAKLIDDKVSKIVEKQKEEERIQKMQENFEKQIKEMREEFKEQINTLISVNQQPSQPVINKEDLENMQKQFQQMLEKKALEDKVKLQEEKAKLQEQLFQAKLNQDAEKIEILKNSLDELSKKIEEARTPIQLSSEGYTRDEYRIIADAMNLVGQKSPIRELGKIVINLQPREQTSEKPLEKVEGEDIMNLVPKELMEEG